MLQFQVSPPKRAPKNSEVNDVENRPALPTYLIIGPHAKVPKIHFQEVKLGKSKKEILILRNPSEAFVNLKFVKKPSSDFKFSCDIDDIIAIPVQDQLILEITWTPLKEGRFFEVCQLINSLNGFKLSLHLLGICTPPPTTFKASRGLPKRRPAVFPLISNTRLNEPKVSSRNLNGPFLNTTKKVEESAPAHETPTKSTALQLIDSATFPFTPEPSRRETFIVENKENNSTEDDTSFTVYHTALEDQNDDPFVFPLSSTLKWSEPSTVSKKLFKPDEISTSFLDSASFMRTPPRSSALELMDSAIFPFTPESGTRRETFIVEKEENQKPADENHLIPVEKATTTIKDPDYDEEDAQIRDDLDEAMAELENLENLIRGFMSTLV